MAQDIVMEGFMLKKKRKALQGYARRYFRLASDGSLSYAFNPNSPIRDSVSVPQAFISASRRYRTLDIDGGNAVYHCKCLSLADFDRWATATKSFIPAPEDAQATVSGSASAQGPQRQSLGGLGARAELDRVYAALAKLSQPICDLELVAHELGQLAPPPAPPSVVVSGANHADTSEGTDLAAASTLLSTSPTQPFLTAPSPSSTSPTSPGGASSPSPGSGGAGGSSGSKFRFLGKRSYSTSQAHPPPGLNRSATTTAAVSSTAAAATAASAGNRASVATAPTPTVAIPTPPVGSGGVGAAPTNRHSLQPQQQRSNSITSSSYTGSSTTTAVPSPAPPSAHTENTQALARQLDEAISVLKATHAELIGAVQALPVYEPTAAAPGPATAPQQRGSGSGGDGSPTATATTPTGAYAGPFSFPAAASGPFVSSPSSPPSPSGRSGRSFSLSRGYSYHTTHTRNALSRASSSGASFVSALNGGGGGGEEWFDAVPGEFVFEEAEAEAERGGSAKIAEEGDAQSSDGEEEEDGVGRDFEDAEAVVVAEEEDEDSGAEDGEDPGRVRAPDGGRERPGVEEEEDEQVKAMLLPAAAVAGQDEPPQGACADEQQPEQQQQQQQAQAQLVKVQRRKQLPHPVAGDEFSMLGMLRKNIGKDLSTISFPVTMNEPISALQRLAEELEYADLLHRAAAVPAGSLERLMLVAVFAVSTAAGNRYRSSRKPFNPLLGETYECVRPELGFRFVSEKVSHHPPVLAFHCESISSASGSPSEPPQWQLYGHVAPNQKFWGRSMEIFVQGDISVRFPASDPEGTTVYSIRKPSSFVKNLVAGTKYIEVVGDLVVAVSNSPAHAVVAFKEGSSWGGVSTRNKIEGRVVDERGASRIELVGRWDDAVDKKEGKSTFTRLWQMADSPPNPGRFYGFSYFTTTLNETTLLEADLLAPTDSRLRPDQLALEYGDVDEAERLKQLVEEKQRAKRREGKAIEPRWFGKDEKDGWTYSGGYWETRQGKKFVDPDIF
ncbi:hypothetical protein JCM8202_004570 [Rhodotorula sphaerocarpa]